MLIRFFVGNFLSFNEQTEFSMVAGQGTAHAHHVIKGKKRHIPNLLRAGLLYGANGSGKSNFVKAIDFAQKLVIGNDLKNLGLQHFKLNKANAQKPTSFQFDILLNDTIYSYGFEILNHQIHEEYLCERGAKRDKIIFERKNADNGKTLMTFDIAFKDKKQAQFLDFVGKGTPKNKLFLAECDDRNVWAEVDNIEEVMSVYSWISDGLRIMFPNSAFRVQIIEDEDYLHFLNNFGMGIDATLWLPIDFDKIRDDIDEVDELSVENLEENENVAIKSIDRENLYLFKNENNEIKSYKLRTQHQGSDAIFEFGEESDGTRRLFDFLPVVGDGFNFTFIIDEIDRSLHPHLSRALLTYFLEQKSGTAAQFIATTHEASLLDLDLLRKDEVWFAEKNETGATDLYSLEEFKPRADTEIRKGYLQGRYGAIPFIENFANQKW